MTPRKQDRRSAANQERIRKLLAQYQPMTVADIAQHLQLHPHTIRRQLQRMELAVGFRHPAGRGPAETTYALPTTETPDV